MPDLSPLFVDRLIWRNQINPLRGLNVVRAVTYLENSERGIYADLQWTYRFMEKRYEVLKACVERWISTLKKLEWDIKIKPGIEKNDPDYAKALEQQANLRAAYQNINNLKEAIEFMAMATFRGYSHLEKHFDNDGDIYHLEPVPQWFWSRRYPSMHWLYNWNATSGNQGVEVEYNNFIIREVPRPINESALIRFIRRQLGEKDWDGYIQAYGIPPLFLELPEGAPYNASQEYQNVANKVISDGRGTLPHGAKIVNVEPRDRTAPFREHISHQDEQVVLAATSGKLSVLNDSTGMGSSQPTKHEDTFMELAEAEGVEISDLFQRQFDAFVLKNEPEILVQFQIAAKDQEDVGQIADNLVKFSQAGLQSDPVEISAKAGIKLVPKVIQPIVPNGTELGAEPKPGAEPKQQAPAPTTEPTPKPKRPKIAKPSPGIVEPASGLDINDGTVRVNPMEPSRPGGPDRGGPDPYPAYPPYGVPVRRAARNRASAVVKKTQAAVKAAFAEELKTLQNRLKGIFDIEDADLRKQKLEEFSKRLPALLKDMNQNPAAADALNKGAVTELVNALA